MNYQGEPSEDKYMKELPKLKRCPFCGSGACACAWPDESGDYNNGDFRVHCHSCSCSIDHDDNAKYFTNQKDAVDFWNKRWIK